MLEINLLSLKNIRSDVSAALDLREANIILWLDNLLSLDKTNKLYFIVHIVFQGLT
jgi:hypothetical protein